MPQFRERRGWRLSRPQRKSVVEPPLTGERACSMGMEAGGLVVQEWGRVAGWGTPGLRAQHSCPLGNKTPPASSSETALQRLDS